MHFTIINRRLLCSAN